MTSGLMHNTSGGAKILNSSSKIKMTYGGNTNHSNGNISYREKLGKYLNLRSPTKNSTNESLKALQNKSIEYKAEQKHMNDSTLKTIERPQLKIEIKSRETLTKKEYIEQNSSNKKNKRQADNSEAPHGRENNYHSPPPQQRHVMDEEDRFAKFGMSPKVLSETNIKERKVREESTRPSKPCTYAIKWLAGAWPKVDDFIRVDRILGQGSFAKVYQGFDLVSKSIVAIKILDKRKLSEMGFQKMAEKELEIIQSISHPNICKFEKMIEDSKRVKCYH